jgi:hypothetical protein
MIIAGQTGGTVDYYPLRGGETYDPVLNGGSMTSMTIKSVDGLTTLATTTSWAKIADGHYRATFATSIASAGDYPVIVVWEATGTGPTVTDTTDTVRVEAFGGSTDPVVSVALVKLRLNKTLSVDDTEILDMIAAASAEYAEWVGPLNGTVTETHHGGGTSLILRNSNPATIVTAVYSDGTTIDVADLDLDTSTGIVYWGYNTAGYFTRGLRNVTVTYTVGAVPANHREAIAADIAGYFAATQREGIPGDEGYQDSWAANPLVLFPRIRSLAAPSIA